MRKKGTNAARGGAASKPSPVPSTSYLKTLIHSHSVFFDSLVDLIPSKFYLPGPDEDEKPWFQGLSKVAKASAKKQSRENLKKARRARFDPQNPSSTLDLLAISSKADQNPSDTDEEIENPRPAAVPSDDRSVTYEELRERLQRRIQELRSNRNTRPTIDREPKGKRKREEESEEDKKENKEEKTADITFGKVKVGDEEGKRRKKKKLSKAQELEKAKKLEELKKDPEKGEIVSKKHSWKAAASRAAGVKIHDDPKLLKESIKKEKKRQKKHSEKWKERTEGRDNARKEKQRTRTENIKERIQQKKTRRIEKREKKLMRPGFEGRKEGYVNE